VSLLWRDYRDSQLAPHRCLGNGVRDRMPAEVLLERSGSSPAAYLPTCTERSDLVAAGRFANYAWQSRATVRATCSFSHSELSTASSWSHNTQSFTQASSGNIVSRTAARWYFPQFFPWRSRVWDTPKTSQTCGNSRAAGRARNNDGSPWLHES
jgi:hypothetical protein